MKSRRYRHDCMEGLDQDGRLVRQGTGSDQSVGGERSANDHCEDTGSC